ncbi:MAG: tRNA (guanosine(37)-N1)-methyltransferase TrmD [Pseudomonadota bacterium]
MWRAHVITLFPDLFPGPLDASVLGRARAENRWSLETTDVRAFSDNAYGAVDAPPFGGGAGLVMRADILAAAIDAAREEAPREATSEAPSETPSEAADRRPTILLTPRGRPLTQARVRALAAGPGALCVCGRFEGVDQRVIEARNIEEISIGDFVLAGGEIAAMALIEACVRLLPGVLGSAHSLSEESFSFGAQPRGPGLLEYPQYAKPRDFEGRAVPPVLLSGDHRAIADWRRDRAEEITRARRPDLWAAYGGDAGGPIRRDDKNED